MLVYAGIDEAGYGPMLGPLCIGAATFILPDADPADGAPDLWDLLSEAVCRKVSDKKKRIAINDSKVLKGASSSKAPSALFGTSTACRSLRVRRTGSERKDLY